MTVQDKLKEYLRARSALMQEANGQFTFDNCPLNVENQHYWLSLQLFGVGNWRWDCEFCGKHDEA